MITNLKTIVDLLYTRNNPYKLLGLYKGVDYKNYMKFNHRKYTNNNIYNDNQFKIDLICFTRFQRTGVHSHDYPCFSKVLMGEIEENLYLDVDKNEYISKIRYTDDISYMKELEEYHDVINREQNSILLNLYVKNNRYFENIQNEKPEEKFHYVI